LRESEPWRVRADAHDNLHQSCKPVTQRRSAEGVDLSAVLNAIGQDLDGLLSSVDIARGQARELLRPGDSRRAVTP
jgi:hypothetical protein